MRLEDLAQSYNPSASITDAGIEPPADMPASALDELILARATGILSTCHQLALDEVRLVGVVINSLDADPNYQPSDSIMAAIQAINRKFASRRIRVLT